MFSPVIAAPDRPCSLDPVLARSHVWRAGELNTHSGSAVDTGYTALNRVLPGGGWPQGVMIEVLQQQAGQQEWGLLAPVLAASQTAAPGALMTSPWVVLVGAPYLPFGPALRARHISMQRMLSIQGESGNAPSLLWATREALHCADAAAVLAWLPDARSAHLRRLQMAANTHHKLLFVFRPLRAQHESSPAPLRLLLESCALPNGNLRVQVIKRRGPPLATPVLLDTRPQRLSDLLEASRERSRLRRAEVMWDPAIQPASATTFRAPLSDLLLPRHALDRTASLHH